MDKNSFKGGSHWCKLNNVRLNKFRHLNNLMQSLYDLCGDSIQQGKGHLPQQKSLEEILKQELKWTLEQVGCDIIWHLFG